MEILVAYIFTSKERIHELDVFLTVTLATRFLRATTAALSVYKCLPVRKGLGDTKRKDTARSHTDVNIVDYVVPLRPDYTTIYRRDCVRERYGGGCSCSTVVIRMFGSPHYSSLLLLW